MEDSRVKGYGKCRCVPFRPPLLSLPQLSHANCQWFSLELIKCSKVHEKGQLQKHPQEQRKAFDKDCKRLENHLEKRERDQSDKLAVGSNHNR